MVYDSMVERILFDDPAAQHELWYQTPEDNTLFDLEEELFVRLA